MTRLELGLFEDDPRSQAGAEALAWLETQQTKVNRRENVTSDDKWGLEPDLDPRVIATKAAVAAERTFDAYRQSGMWVMQEGKEYNPSQH